MPALPAMLRGSNARVQRIAEKSLAEPSNVDMMDWQILRASRQPGPGEYKMRGMADGKGVKLAESKPPGFIEQIIAHANDTPAPGDDRVKPELKGLAGTTPGGRMGTSIAKGMLDWVELLEKDRPGPCAYHPEGKFGPEMVERASRRINGAGACSLKNDPTNMTIVWEEKRSRSLPGAQYDTEKSYQYIHPKKGMKMSHATEKSMIEWIEHRARQTPGPGGTYDVGKSFERTQEVSKGIRHGNGNIGKRYVDLLIEPRARSTPGPANYDVDTSMQHLGISCVKTGGGFSFTGRPSVGALPAPFQSLSAPSIGNTDIRLDKSVDYGKSLTPWRESEVRHSHPTPPPPAISVRRALLSYLLVRVLSYVWNADH